MSSDTPRPALRETAGSIRLFHLLGIDFTATWSCLVLAVLLAYGAGAIARAEAPGVTLPWLVALAAGCSLLVGVSLYAHELGHALVARAFGLPVRTISLFLLGGMTHIRREAPTPRAEFLIGLVGPAVSAALGLAGLALSALPEPLAPASHVVGSWLALVNLPLALFNLVPGYPLDGGRVLRGVVWFAGEDPMLGSKVASVMGQAVAGGLFLGGLFDIFLSTGNPVSGIFLIVVAWYVAGGAMAVQRLASINEVLKNVLVSDVMQRRGPRVDAQETLREFAAICLAHPGAQPSDSYGVYREGALVGVVGLGDLRRVPSHLWAESAVDKAMTAVDLACSVLPRDSALKAFQILSEESCELVAVVSDGELLGLVSHDDLLKAVERLRQPPATGFSRPRL